MKWSTIYTKVIGIVALSVILVVTLFLLSEHQVHRNNAFTRRYPPHPIIKKFNLDIIYNSYYIAGYGKDVLYLGNTTAPMHLLQVNLKSRDTIHITIKTQIKTHTYEGLQIRVLPPYFFVMDGITPVILRGRVETWEARIWAKDRAYFSMALPIDSNTVFIRSVNSRTQSIMLGLIEKKDSLKIQFRPEILEKKTDGIFAMDGIMTAYPDKSHLGYIYFYHNQYIIFDTEINAIRKSYTIDTVQQPQIQLAHLRKKGITEMSAPPLFINLGASLYENLLMVHSNRLGRNEDKDMLNNASIVDVYNWDKSTYEFSFYIYNINNSKVKEFGVFDNYLVALIGNHLSIYNLVEHYFNALPSKLVSD